MQDLIERIKRENYFESLSQQNLRVRNATSGQHALDIYIANIREPNNREKAILNECIVIANTCIERANFDKLSAVPWKILVANDHIESGFPHTHFDYIIIPRAHIAAGQKRPQQLAFTLIHEKIHVFQRLYPLETNTLYIKHWNLHIAAHRNMLPNMMYLRQNPDTNEIVYKDAQGFIANYLKKDAEVLSDTEDDRRDHPHEMMAYVLTYILSQGKSYLDPVLQRYLQSATNWMASHSDQNKALPI